MSRLLVAAPASGADIRDEEAAHRPVRLAAEPVFVVFAELGLIGRYQNAGRPDHVAVGANLDVAGGVGGTVVRAAAMLMRAGQVPVLTVLDPRRGSMRGRAAGGDGKRGRKREEDAHRATSSQGCGRPGMHLVGWPIAAVCSGPCRRNNGTYLHLRSIEPWASGPCDRPR